MILGLGEFNDELLSSLPILFGQDERQRTTYTEDVESDYATL